MQSINAPSAPQIWSITGCPGAQIGNRTTGCPTNGGIPITVTGAYFYGSQEVRVEIGGHECGMYNLAIVKLGADKN
jgi:hypothetical protein